MLKNVLRRDLLKTLAYYDAISFFPTASQCWQFLIFSSTYSFSDVLLELKRLVAEDLLVVDSGFYSLVSSGQSDVFQQAIRQRYYSDKKRRLLRRFLRKIQWIPFLQTVVLSGSVAIGNATRTSDIDLYIIARAGRIWIVRFFVTAIFHLTRQRRFGTLISNRVCLNHYVVSSSIVRTTIAHSSLYNAMTYAHWIVVSSFSPTSFLEQLFKKHCSPFLQLVFLPSFSYWFRAQSRLSFVVQRFLEWLLGGFMGNIFSFFARVVQCSVYRLHYRSYQYGRIRFSDEEIELHPFSPERTVLDRFHSRLRQLDIDQQYSDSGLYDFSIQQTPIFDARHRIDVCESKNRG